MKIICICDEYGHLNAYEYNLENIKIVAQTLSKTERLDEEIPSDISDTVEAYEEFLTENGPVGRSGGNILDFLEVENMPPDFHPWG
jgi:uncharacterized protein with von Willebrand factor type A (vWA) domain